MIEAMEELETLKSIRRGLDDMEAGRTVDAKRVHERLRKL
jgi:predicted transcriptional regulator